MQGRPVKLELADKINKNAKILIPKVEHQKIKKRTLNLLSGIIG
jgi:hypothetical protein